MYRQQRANPRTVSGVNRVLLGKVMTDLVLISPCLLLRILERMLRSLWIGDRQENSIRCGVVTSSYGGFDLHVSYLLCVVFALFSGYYLLLLMASYIYLYMS